MQAGQHFKTDVITGMIVGTLVGNLVPHFHRNKSLNSSKLTLLPNYQDGATGFTAYYKLGRLDFGDKSVEIQLKTGPKKGYQLKNFDFSKNLTKIFKNRIS